MQSEKVIERAELAGDFLLSTTLAIELERHGETSDSCSRVIYAKCHYYCWVDAVTGIDLFVIEAGRLRKVASYNGVLSLKEIDADDANA